MWFLWLLFTIKDNDFRLWFSSLKEGDSNGNTEIPGLSIGQREHSNEETEAGVVVRCLGTGWGARTRCRGYADWAGHLQEGFVNRSQRWTISVCQNEEKQKRCMKIWLRAGDWSFLSCGQYQILNGPKGLLEDLTLIFFIKMGKTDPFLQTWNISAEIYLGGRY